MKLRNQDTARFFRSLGLLLHAGIGLADSLYLLAEEETAHKSLLTQMGKAMDGGSTLSRAMEESGGFAAFAWGLVHIGEETGRVEESLNALADYYEERHRTNQRLKNAVAYPAAILLMMLVVIAVLLMFVLPVFDNVYISLGSRLTGVAAALLHFGKILKNLLPVILTLLAMGFLAAGAIALIPALQESVTAQFQKAFGDRGILRKFNNARFARAMAMGLGSGLTLEDALSLSARLLSDVPEAKKRCDDCAAALQEGASLSEAMGRGDLLPAADLRMLAVGLKGGNADRVMEEIAAGQMEEAQTALDAMISRVEPAMVLTASVLVGMILLSVMLPLLNILSALG